MPQIKINIAGGWQPCSIAIDLDPTLPQEQFFLKHISAGQFYEPDVSQLFLRLLRAGDTVVDVGANIGYFTMLAAALVGHSGKVLSFEPDPGNCARLHTNLALSGFDNVTVVHHPAMDFARPADLFINRDSGGGHALWDVAEWPTNVLSQETHEVISLEGTTVDEEIARTGFKNVKLMKIDTEGADHLVLQGASKLLSGGAVPFVICELHDFGLAKMASSPAAMRSFMEELGYTSFMLNYSGNLPQMVPHGTNIQYNYICNILFSTPQAIATYWPSYHHDPAVR